MQTIDFDLDRFIRTSDRVDLSEVEWDRATDPPLTDAHVRVLRYMMDIETNTVIFLRDVLATQTAFDPDVTAFLSCWNFEELWHGEAFSRLLGEAGIPVRPDHETVTHDSPFPSRRSRTEWIRRRIGAKGNVSHLGTLLGSAIASEDFVAIHMTWGAVNELTTLTAYHRMIAQTENVALTQVLRAIIKQERRHFAFYRAQARLRLAESQRARRLVRWTIGSPLGAGGHRHPAAGGNGLRHGIPVQRSGRCGRPEGDGRDHRGAPRPGGNPLPLRGSPAIRGAARQPVRGMSAAGYR
jgi:rubrerythrin